MFRWCRNILVYVYILYPLQGGRSTDRPPCKGYNVYTYTDQAHDKHQWTTTNIFSQVHLYTPWWWIAYDPKHVGMIFNLMYFRFLYNVDFNL